MSNETIHPVEKEHHYAKMIKAGFIPETKEAVGFVRFYRWNHPVLGITIDYHIGASCDYWRGPNGAGGYWGTLQGYLDGLPSESEEVTDDISVCDDDEE